MTGVSGSHRQVEARNGTFDGLRGLAILVVVLSHAWVVYPFTNLSDIAPFDGWFKAGSIGVSMFLVLSGFLVTRSMLGGLARAGQRAPFTTLVRRFIRISAQVYLLVAVILIVAQVDDTDTATSSATTNSVRAIVTYTWNWYVRDNALDARGDLGHLWYLSVEMQFFVVLAVVLALWGRHRLKIAAGVAILLVAATWWRWHVYQTEGWYSASLRTSTRVDAALWGVLAALLWDRLDMVRRDATAIIGASALVIIGVIFSASRLGIDAYFGWQGIAIAAATTLFVVAASADQVRDNPAVRLFNLKPLRVLGGSSLTLYVWHLPLFYAITRHTPSWDASARAILAVVLLAAITVVLHRGVDEPLKRWTARIGRPRPAVTTDA
ncbi:hypothetical protein ASG91_03345 [Phycicoccus sp. Soil802]|nr:hypothetical protein ASG91_03345 [Phycicoccus sp. Soil802]